MNCAIPPVNQHTPPGLEDHDLSPLRVVMLQKLRRALGLSWFSGLSPLFLLPWLLLLLLAGCSDAAFYWQAGSGHMSILQKRRPISEVLADESTPEDIRKKLHLILEVQNFGSTALALPEKGHYQYYADLGRPYVTWLVVASKPLRIEEHPFCYLIVGCLGYKGFFEKAEAEALVEELRAEGLDVMLRGVRAYSTLGWFDDPVLNTFLRNNDLNLIGTVIHELAHQVYFLKGDTAFNESFAAAVEEAGVRKFLADRAGGAEMLERYDQGRAEEARFQALILKGRERLVAFYGTDTGGETRGKSAEQFAERSAETLRQKEALFEKMRQDYRAVKDSFKIYDYQGWFERPLNNAHLVGLGHYAQYLPAFRALLQQQQGDFFSFYEAVRILGALPPKEREARLKQLESSNMAMAH